MEAAANFARKATFASFRSVTGASGLAHHAMSQKMSVVAAAGRCDGGRLPYR